MDKIRNRFMRLPVKLTEEELDKKKGELVEWTRVRAEGEHRLEARVAEMKEEKKQMEAEVLSAAGYANRAADTIEAGEERRDVEVTDFFDGPNIVTIRSDTKETVASRPATEDERQMVLPHPELKACICTSGDVAAVDCPMHGTLETPPEENWECESCGATTSGDACGACGVERGKEPEKEEDDGSPSEDV